MHKFLRAIGFRETTNSKDLDKIIDEAIDHPNHVVYSSDSQGNEFVELTKNYGHGFGLKLCGQFVDEENFALDYYYPYFSGEGITTEEKIEVERHAGRESYAGICDEIKLGVALIFYIQNVCEYLNEKNRIENCLKGATVTISGLSTGGIVILPIDKKHKRLEKNTQHRNSLMAAARDGDEEAMESLTMDDLDTFSMLSRRVTSEDILSIVDTSFMPYGVESDQYSIIGEILAYTMVPNKETLEELYVLTLNVNDLIFDMMINQKDLMGEPAIGRRFKGTVWLQGKIHFMD